MKNIIQKILKEEFEEDYSWADQYDHIMDGNDLQRMVWEYRLKEIPGHITKVIGDLDLSVTNIQSLNNLEEVEGVLNLIHSDIRSLGKLKKVSGDLKLQYTEINSLGNLEYVGGYLDVEKTKIQSLGNLKYVGKYLDISGTAVRKTMTKDQIKQQVKVKEHIINLE